MSKESILQKVNFAYRHMASVGAQCGMYRWDAAFCKSELEKAAKETLPHHRLTNDEISEIDQDLAIELGLGLWSDDENLYLFPLSLLPILPIGLELTSVCGGKGTTTEDLEGIDTDNRAGFLAYGIVIEPVEECASLITVVSPQPGDTAYLPADMERMGPSGAIFIKPGTKDAN